MEKKLGIYICTGCGIGKCLNTSELQGTIKKEFGNTIIKEHSFLCSKEGTYLINDDINHEKPEGIIIAACSSRVHNLTFSFNSNIITERVNIREHIAWSQNSEDEDTQMLAADMIRMGIAKVQSISLTVPYLRNDLNSTILVIGGGIAGITAAIEGAKAGYKIILVEKEDSLGGWSTKLYKQLPQKSPYTQLESPLIVEKINETENLSNIEILTSSEIKEISGQPGMFDVSISQNGKGINRNVGSIVLATGWKPYDASKLTQFGYASYKNIITNIEFEQLAKEGKIIRPSDSREVNSVLFIQCAGSRDENHLPYCSNFCCGTSLKQAKYIRDFNKKALVYVIYKDIRTPGQYENFYKEIQNDEGIFLTKGEITSIVEEGDNLIVEASNTLLNENISLKVDMVVLATGMTPSNSEDLNLTYRLGKGLPNLKYDFPDSHFICFPYETRRTGIFAAGTIRAPMDIISSTEDACGAMLKAIQCVEATKRGESLHPRAGDQTYPELFMDRCTDCKRCTEECPFGSYDETEKGTPQPNPNRCRRCGICLGACPERIISFSDFSVNSVSSMIKAVEIPDEFEEKPRILVFACENDAYPAFDIAGLKRLKYSPYIRIIPVRCLGAVNNIWISDALSAGFDGILQLGCKPGDDYQCHFIHGSELTETRGKNIQETLGKMMLEPERIRTEFIEISEYHKIPKIINDYIETIEEIGPNPFKGM